MWSPAVRAGQLGCSTSLFTIQLSRFRWVSLLVVTLLPLTVLAVLAYVDGITWKPKAYILTFLWLVCVVFAGLYFSYIFFNAARQGQAARHVPDRPLVHTCLWAVFPFAELKELRSSPSALNGICFREHVLSSKRIEIARARGVIGPQVEDATQGTGNGNDERCWGAAVDADAADTENQKEGQLDTAYPVLLGNNSRENHDEDRTRRNSTRSSDDACPCCLEVFSADHQVALLRCGHFFCERCIEDWVCKSRANSTRCPVCRHVFATSKHETV